MRVTILEAKNRLAELVKAARDGEEVIITNRGEPVVRVVLAATEEPRSAGDPERILAWKKNNALPSHLRRAAEEIDGEIRAERNAWD